MKKVNLLVAALLISVLTSAQLALPLDFEQPATTYTFTDFAGGNVTITANTQSSGINTSAQVAKMIKFSGQTYGGSFISLAAPINFSVNKTFKLKVFSPRVGAKVLLKVENLTVATTSFEKEVLTTVANTWEELTFDYSAISTVNQYQKIVFIFDNGIMGDGSANFTFLFDDLRLVAGGGGGGSTNPVLPLDFESATTNYSFTDFDGGAVTVINNPQSSGINTSSRVGKMVKNVGQTYGGSFIVLNAPIDFTINRTFRMKVYSPRVGAKVLLKVENSSNAATFFEKEVLTTVANTWEDLTFDYSAVSTTNQYQKLVLIFDNGTMGDGSGNFTFLFDDIRLTSGGGSSLTQMDLPVTFDISTVDYGLIGFGGAEQSTIVTDPTSATNKVAKVIKTATAQAWAGTTVTAAAGLGLLNRIPFSVTNTKMNVRVWSPDAGIPVRLKVEEHADATHSVETEATVTTAAGWQVLTFNFLNQAAGTNAINLTYNYDKVSIFFNFGTTGAVAGEKTYYFDDVKFGDGNVVPVLTQMDLPVTFDVSTVDYGLIGFGGAEQSTIVTDPTSATNKVAKVIKTATAQAWAGTTVTAAAGLGLLNRIPFSVTNTKMNVRVWSPDAGIPVRLKVEEHADATHSVETEATVTTVAGWQVLTFNFLNQAAGTNAINLTYNYDKVSIFFNFGTTGAVAGEKTYYFDDVKFGDGGSVIVPTNPVLPLDFESSTVNYTFTDFDGGAVTVIPNPQSSGMNTSSKVGKMVKSMGQTYGGSFISLNGPIDFSTLRTFKMKVYSPRAGAKVLLKVENQTNAAINFEKEVLTTVANSWEDLTFDYSAINISNQYQKVVLIFDNGTMGDGSANFTFLFDDIRLTSGGGSSLTQMDLPVTFDASTVDYGLIGFGGAEQSTIVTDPTAATNKVAKVIKTASAQSWAGTTVTAAAGLGLLNRIPFTVTNTKMNVRVWSPDAGIPVRLKVEEHADATHSVETEATVTTAAGWQVLTFNFLNQAAGTNAINLTYNYDKVSIFFNFGTSGAVAGEKTYYFDDVKFGDGGSVVVPTNPVLPLDFESSTVNYTFTDFDGGAVTVISNPQSSGINTSSKVGKMVKSMGQTYGGSFISLDGPIDFSSIRTFKMKVYSPRVGAKVLLKVENQTNAAINFEKEVLTTVANSWEDLTFDYSAINTTNQYQKVVLIFDNGTMGDGSSNFTFLFDDLRLATGGGGGGGTLTQMDLPVTFDAATVDYGLIGFAGAEQSTIVTDPTLSANKVAKVIKTATAQIYAGTTISAPAGLGLLNRIPFTASNTKMSVRVWSPDAGIPVRLKVEDHTDATHSVETESLITVSAGWQILEFDFAQHVAGTNPLNLAYNYDKVTIFFNFGTSGSTAGEKTYYFDNVAFIGGGGVSALPQLPLDFQSSSVSYSFVDFDGGSASVIDNVQVSGINTSTRIGKMVKNAGQTYGGSYLTLASAIDFSVNRTFKMKVFAPRAGARVLLKVENASNSAISYEKEVATTLANTWEELSFDFGAISASNQYQKVVLIFDNGMMGDGSANFTYLFDDLRLVLSGGSGNNLSQMNIPLTFDDPTVNYGLIGFDGADQSVVTDDPTVVGNKLAKIIRSATALTTAGTIISAAGGAGFATRIPFAFNRTKMLVRVWSPDAGIKVRLKLEDHSNALDYVVSEATVTTVAGWEELVFDFAANVPGTPALVLNDNYDKATIYFNYGVAGSISGEKTYYFDDLRLAPENTGGGNDDDLNLISVYPNPSADFFNISNQKLSPLDIVIMDASGRVMRRVSSTNPEIRINMSGYAAGSYFLMLRNRANGFKVSKKLIKK